MAGKGSSQPIINNHPTQRRKKPRKFFIPKTKQQFQTCLGRMTIQFFNIAFQFADKAMYILGPILITLATVIIVGLTYVYFRVILPMLAGTNWVFSNADWHIYWKDRGYEAHEGQAADADDDGSIPISRISSTFLALSTPMGILHTLIMIFFLTNIIYNYYQCVMTSNSGKRYELVVRELAQVTGFQYPETEEELVQCKKDFERKIYGKIQKRRDEMMAASRAGAASVARTVTSAVSPSLGTSTPGNARANGDEQSQNSQSSPLMATTNSLTNPPTTTAVPTPTNNSPVKLPRIHNWQLLSPIEWGYCRYSSRPKPPRSHYDHVTKGLVLNMDHYCPWMFNCVGYFNYRYFFNFLWFVTTALWYGTAICFPAFMKLGGKEYRDQVRASGGYQTPKLIVKHIASNPFIPTPDERSCVALGFMLCVCLAAAVMCLGGFHLYLVLTAQSTIEFHGNFSKRRKKGGWKNPYSAGSWRKNWEMIYGTRFWSLRHDDNSDGYGSNNGEDEEQFRYRGCWGIFVAMMPSSREPEFLPLPINETLVRRKNKDASVGVDKKMDLEMGSSEVIPKALLPINEMLVRRKKKDASVGVNKKTDLEMGSSEVISKAETLSPDPPGETEFLMEPKNTNGPLVGRGRAQRKTTEERVV